MSNITCDIIRDLMPSYIDDICSLDSAALVQEHMKTCSGCAAYYQRMRGTQLVADKTDQAVSGYLKKVKSHYHTICVTAVAITAFLVFLLHIGNFAVVNFSGWLFYVLTPVLIIAGSLCQSKNPDRGRASAVFIILSVAMIAYAYVLWYLILNALETGTKLFMIETSKVGPYIEIQFVLMIFAELAMFAWVSVRKGDAPWTNRMLLVTSAAGIGNLVELITLMWKLEGTARVRTQLMQTALVYAVEVVVFVGAGALWRSLQKKETT